MTDEGRETEMSWDAAKNLTTMSTKDLKVLESQLVSQGGGSTEAAGLLLKVRAELARRVQIGVAEAEIAALSRRTEEQRRKGDGPSSGLI